MGEDVITAPLSHGADVISSLVRADGIVKIPAGIQGIRAAASALGLDFVPLFEEHYDLVIPSEHMEHSMVKYLLALLHNPEFCASVQAQPGDRI